MVRVRDWTAGADGDAAAIVQPFPAPGPLVQQAYNDLALAASLTPDQQQALGDTQQLPRPWDPASCTGRMRTELWAWLDMVATWVNEQHLWNVVRPGIPECWPAHPHLVHDLAVLACSRYGTRFTVTPAALEDWHRHGLPGFLERLRDRLGDGCQPGKHQTRPRRERDAAHASTPVRRGRQQHYRDDLDRAAELAAPSRRDEPRDDYVDLHERW